MRDPTAKNRQIFKFLLEEPSTLYRIYTRSNKKIRTGTISKILKKLKERGYIRTYKPLKPKEEKTLKRDLWGPSISGIIEICILEDSILKKLKNIFSYWLEYPEFRKEIKIHGFDVKLLEKNPSKVKNLFQDYVEFCVARRREIYNFLENPMAYGIGTLDFLGEILLVSRDPEYQKLTTELYTEMPGVKKTVDLVFKNYRIQYRKMKNSK